MYTNYKGDDVNLEGGDDDYGDVVVDVDEDMPPQEERWRQHMAPQRLPNPRGASPLRGPSSLELIGDLYEPSPLFMEAKREANS
jgi:hypothetical protein